MNNAIIDAACISTQNGCVKIIFYLFFIKKSIMNFSESRQNRSRENREKSKNRFFFPPLHTSITNSHQIHYLHIPSPRCTHTHARTHTHTNTHMHTHTHTHTHTHSHTDTHKHMHTHTHN